MKEYQKQYWNSHKDERSKYHKQYDEKLRTYITKPKIEITNENYRYLQFIDILENRDNINIEVENANLIIERVA